LTLGLLVAGGSLLLGIYFWKSTPKGGPIDIDAETQRVEAFFDPLTPVETWVYWHQQTVPVAREGLKEELPPGAEQRKEEIDRGRTRQTLAFGLAGLAVLFCIGLLLWRPGRRT
jgi:hypothetical protein